MPSLSRLIVPDGTTYDLRALGIPFAQVDSTSTSKAFTATIPGITEYYDGLTIMLKNGVVTSASGFTININGLGAKQSYTNLAAATADTTLFNINYTMLFVYDSTRVEGGGWICYRGYDANTNTIGYQLRTNSSTLPTTDKFYRYRILFTAADGKHWVPSTTSTSTNATASRDVNQRPIDPFGDIVYYGTTTAVEANANVAAAQLWQQYTLTLGYAFNRTNAALELTYPSPIYIKCAPQANGSAIIDATTPYVLSLPSTEDGKIYIYLGRTYSATAIEMVMVHPVYYYKDGAIRLWTNAAAGLSSVAWDDVTDKPTFATVATSGSYADLSNKPDMVQSVNGVDGRVAILRNGSEISATGTASGGTIDITVPTKTSDLTNDSGFITGYTETDPTVPAWAKAASKPTYTASEVGALPSTTTIPTASTTNPSMDGTASYGSGTAYARSNHVHPTDTSRQATLVSGTNIKTVNSTSLLGSGNVSVQATLVSGTNIKTVNGNSLLGSGNLAISGLPSVTASDNGKVLKVVNGAWAAASLNVYSGGVS